MRSLRNSIIALSLLLPLLCGAAELPCDTAANAIICAFLNRYIRELQQWKRKDVSLQQKMKDDKFLILDGNLSNLKKCNDTTVCNITRHDDKAYEAEWKNGEQMLLRVAFPVQYELILGMPKNELERYLPDYITAAIDRKKLFPLEGEEIGDGIFRSIPRQHYQIEQLNNSIYYREVVDATQENSKIYFIDDTSHVEYTIANLFHVDLRRDYNLMIRQSIYGGEDLTYTVPLLQWIIYCENADLTSYVAVEDETSDGWKVLVVAESSDLKYNHLLSVFIPREVLSQKTGTLPVKLNAFIPTHNIKELFEEEQK